MPEDVGDGEEFDLVCTFRVKNQTVCLVKMGDSEMPGYKDSSKHKPDYSDAMPDQTPTEPSGE